MNNQTEWKHFIRNIAELTLTSIDNLNLDKRCSCGGVILADTEDWNIQFCYECYAYLEKKFAEGIK